MPKKVTKKKSSAKPESLKFPAKFFDSMKDATINNFAKLGPAKKTMSYFNGPRRKEIVERLVEIVLNNAEGVDQTVVYTETLKQIWDLEKTNNSDLFTTVMKKATELTKVEQALVRTYCAAIELLAKDLTKSLCGSVKHCISKRIKLGQNEATDKVVGVNEPNPSKKAYLRCFKYLEELEQEHWYVNRVRMAEGTSAPLGELFTALSGDKDKFKKTAKAQMCPNMVKLAAYQRMMQKGSGITK